MHSKACPDMVSGDLDSVKKCYTTRGGANEAGGNSFLEDGAGGNESNKVRRLRPKNKAGEGFSQFEISKALYTSGLLQQVKLSATAKLVLIALVNHYNPKKKDMFPSQKFMANQLGISEKSAERAIKDLKAEGLVIYATKKVNHYKFTQKFFEQVKLSDKIRQNVGNDVRQIVGQTKEHEQKNNKVQFENSFKGGYKQNSYQQAGVDYQRYEPPKYEVDEKTPLSDFETAKAYLVELQPMENIPVVRKKMQDVRFHWAKKGRALP